MAIPKTSVDFGLELILLLPKGFLRVDLDPECYFKNSMKASERAKRGFATKIILRSQNQKSQRKFQNFLQWRKKGPYDRFAISNNKREQIVLS